MTFHKNAIILYIYKFDQTGLGTALSIYIVQRKFEPNIFIKKNLTVYRSVVELVVNAGAGVHTLAWINAWPLTLHTGAQPVVRRAFVVGTGIHFMNCDYYCYVPSHTIVDYLFGKMLVIVAW